MTRLAFMAGYKGQDPSEKPADAAKENLLGYFTCETRVAKFLKIDTLYSRTVKRTRAAYTKSVMIAGVGTEKTIPAGEIEFVPDTRARSRTVILKTGMSALKTKRTLSLTFPSKMTVAQIGEALAEYIPDATIQRGATAPSNSEIYPQYKIKGGRTYPLPLKIDAESSLSVDAPSTPAEQAALASKAK